MVGAKYGFAKMDRSTGEIEYIKKVWEEKSDVEKADKSADVTVYAEVLLTLCKDALQRWGSR